jgi:hypothetical protein
MLIAGAVLTCCAHDATKELSDKGKDKPSIGAGMAQGKAKAAPSVGAGVPGSKLNPPAAPAADIPGGPCLASVKALKVGGSMPQTLGKDIPGLFCRGIGPEVNCTVEDMKSPYGALVVVVDPPSGKITGFTVPDFCK